MILRSIILLGVSSNATFAVVNAVHIVDATAYRRKQAVGINPHSEIVKGGAVKDVCLIAE